MQSHSLLVGYIAVVISVFFFGTYGVFTKTRALRINRVDPILVQCYMSAVIFLSSWLVAIYTGSFHFTYLGILSALLWVPASILATTAIRLVGLGIAQGTWAGVTIIVSFIWGVVVFHDSPVHSIGLKVLGVLVLVVGIIAVATTIGDDDGDSDSSANERDLEYSIQEEETSLLKANTSTSTNENGNNGNGKKKSKRKALLGLLSACILGLFNGCMLIPMKYVPAESGGIGFAMSFGIGTVIVTAIIAPLYYYIVKPKDGITWYKVKVGMIPASFAGIFWNVGNIASVVATQSELGLTLGFPLCQCALLVSALWGLFKYHEIKGKRNITQLFVGSVVLLAGAAMMSLLG